MARDRFCGIIVCEKFSEGSKNRETVYVQWTMYDCKSFSIFFLSFFLTNVRLSTTTSPAYSDAHQISQLDLITQCIGRDLKEIIAKSLVDSSVTSILKLSWIQTKVKFS